MKPEKSQLPEQQFIDLVRRIHEEGGWKNTRQVSVTGKPSRARTIIGGQLRIKPEDGFPFLSLRNLRGAFKFFIGEMLWILSGSTSLEQLQKYGVHYWDSWADAEHCGWYDLPVGEFGRTYGAQWRSFNAGGPEPIDQVKRVFDILAKNPEDRGMVITPWNPYDVDHLVVKPCHGHVQFVHVEGKLNMLVTQRSADVPVGIPSNLVMYKFFQMLVCMKTGLKEGDYVHNMGDTHYYEDQWPGVELMIEREAKPFPKVTIDPIMVRILDMMLEGEVDPLGTKEINPEGKPYTELIEQWVKLEGYDPHPAVPRDMMPVAI